MMVDLDSGMITALGTVLGAIGGILGTWALVRKTAREDAQQLIDQLQEERTAAYAQIEKERAAAREDRLAYEAKIDAFWVDKDASRRYVAELEQHIYEGKPPPPPVRPAGYIP